MERIALRLRPRRPRLLVQRGNPARFSEPHRVAAFPSGKGEEARLHVRAEGGAFAEGCRLYVQYHDDRQRLGSFSLTLRGPSQTMTFRAPPGGATASIALRLAAAGILPPLALSVKLTAGAEAGARDPAIAAFDRLALLAAGAASRIAGVYETEDGPPRRQALRHPPRPGGAGLSAALPIAGLVFDDTIAHPFGWQGTFDENTYANLALIRILGQMERAGLPSILVSTSAPRPSRFSPSSRRSSPTRSARAPRRTPGSPQILRLA